MVCGRCHIDFCWCCMSKYRNHSKWYALCPNLPFSLCVNVLIVLSAMIFMHVIMTLFALGGACYFSYELTLKKMMRHCKIIRKERYERGWKYCIDFLFHCFIYITIILPIALGLGAVFLGFLIGLGTIPAFYYGFAYIIRLIYNLAS